MSKVAMGHQIGYMELGDDRKALDDCNASLRYGSITDAIKRKQELLTKLSH
jgi:hypothetical protein